MINASIPPLTLDVREAIQRKEAPFDKIMQALHDLKPGSKLRLITPFEPTPLFSFLKPPFFSIQSNTIADKHWESIIQRDLDGGFTPPSVAPHSFAPSLSPPHLEIDLRHLEPPEPLVKALQAFEAEPQGTVISVRTERRPIHLIDALESRGATHETHEQTDGSWITLFQRN